jgi:DHA2 family multidrug resistance protein
MGLVFVPTSTLCYTSLDRRLIDQAAPFNALVRNIGSSAGISIMVALVSHYTIVNHAVLNEAVNVFNPNIMGLVPDLPNQPQAAAALESTIGREAAMTGYCNAFVVMTYATLLLPLTLLLMHRVRKTTAASTTHFAHEM